MEIPGYPNVDKSQNVCRPPAGETKNVRISQRGAQIDPSGPKGPHRDDWAPMEKIRTVRGIFPKIHTFRPLSGVG